MNGLRGVTVIAVLLVVTAATTTAANASSVHPKASFAYGYDFDRQAPDYFRWNNSSAVTSARQVMKSIPSIQVQASMGWGVGNPEPSPGNYEFASLDDRIKLIQSTGGTPVIDLCGAPDWMKGGLSGQSDYSKLTVAPTPAHYKDFATMSAAIAVHYPDVKYFVVWKEFMGFWGSSLPGDKRGQVGNWNVAEYTQLYNDVYAAIKKVRPDAVVGGPYAPIVTFAKPMTASVPSSPQGPWGAVDQRGLDAITYWLQHAIGADFVAVDGQSYTKDAGFVTDPLSETNMFTAVGKWIKATTSLPIWWMESPVQPDGAAWQGSRGAALRVGALIRMAEGGVSLSMQWQPEDGAGITDEGLWTSTRMSGGGRPTSLATVLPRVLPVLQKPLTESPNEPAGVLVAQSAAGLIALNTTGSVLLATINGARLQLTPGQILVQ